MNRHIHTLLVSTDNLLTVMNGTGLEIRQFMLIYVELDSLRFIIHPGDADNIIVVFMNINIDRNIRINKRLMECNHAVESIGRDGVKMMGILSYEVPALLELLQEIGIEQMGASLLAKGLISEVNWLSIDNGMEKPREEGTAKDAVGLLELDYRGIVRGKEHIEVGTEVSDPVHLWHAFKLGQEIEEALYLLFVLGCERLGVDGEIGLLVPVTDDTTVEAILDLLDVDMILVGDLRHVVQNGVLSPYLGNASLAELMVNHSDDLLHTDTIPSFEKPVKSLLSHTVILTIRHNILK